MRLSKDLRSRRHRSSFVAFGLVVAVVSLLTSAAPALAEAPWWHLTSASRPSILPTGGEGTLVVWASNLSATAIEGANEAVTLTDTLPKGIEVLNNSEGEPEVTGVYGFEASSRGVTCSSSTVAGSAVVLCTFEGTLLPYELFEVKIRVRANAVPSEPNKMTVSGGGAPTVSASRPVAVGFPPPGFGVEQYEFTPENAGGSPATQAGAHPFQLTTTLLFNAGIETGAEGEVQVPALAKDVRVKLPPGLVGNPTAFPQCTAAQFGYVKNGINMCPTDTQIGVARVTFFSGNVRHEATVASPLYNLVPGHGEPARFGFIGDLFPVVLSTSIRTGSDYGVTVTTRNITEEPSFLASQITIWGNPGDPRHDNARGAYCLGVGRTFGAGCTAPEDSVDAPFLTMPSVCGQPSSEPLESSVSVDSWADPSAQSEPAVYKWHDSAGDPLALDGCDKLGFEPSISVAPDGQAASTPTGLSVAVRVPQEEILTPNGLAQSDVKDTMVTLPEGVALSPAGADGLQACSLEQIGLQTAGSPTCPMRRRSGPSKLKRRCCPNRWKARPIWPRRTRTRSGR